LTKNIAIVQKTFGNLKDENKAMIETQFNTQLAVVEKLTSEKKEMENNLKDQQAKVSECVAVNWNPGFVQPVIYGHQ